MTENRFREILANRNETAKSLCKRVPGMGTVCMSYIVNGAAMPTRESMEHICRELECEATDIWDKQELDLNVTRTKVAVRADGIEDDNDSVKQPVRERHNTKDWHEGQERVFFWLSPDEKQALNIAVRGLGYRSTTEWFREMYRQTLKQYAALRLDNVSINDLVSGKTVPFSVPVNP